MGRAERLAAEGEGGRGNRVGFAVTVLQRRLASSPEAIYQSLSRRRKRLEERCRDVRAQARAAQILQLERPLSVDIEDFDEDIDDLEGDELESVEEQRDEEEASARTWAELGREMATREGPGAQAEGGRGSGGDKKGTELLGGEGETTRLREQDSRPSKPSAR